MKTSIAVIAVLTLGFGLAATADAKGFYAGAGASMNKVKVTGPRNSFDDTPLGWHLVAGYEMSANWAFEGQYVSVGEADGVDIEGPATTELTMFTFSALRHFALRENMGLYAKAGIYDGDEKVKTVTRTWNVKGNGVALGAGLRYDFGRYTMRAEYDWFDTNGSFHSLGASLLYRF